MASSDLAAVTHPAEKRTGTRSGDPDAATLVTWFDGRSAISIECDLPGSCQSRAIAMCNGPNYTVLKSDNMPTRGNATSVRGAASVRGALQRLGRVVCPVTTASIEELDDDRVQEIEEERADERDGKERHLRRTMPLGNGRHVGHRRWRGPGRCPSNRRR